MPAQRDDGAEGTERHDAEGGNGQLRATHPVGEDAAERAQEGADDGAGEGDIGRLLRELGLQQRREGGRVADEGAEGADVEEGDQPGVVDAQRPAICRQVGDRGVEVVHGAPGQDGRDEGQWHEDQASALEVDAGADRDDERDDHLDDPGAEVAAGGVEPQRLALLRLRIEEGDIRHRGGEVAAAEAGECGAGEKHAIRLLGRDTPGEGKGRQQQQEAGDDRPVAPAEAGDGEGVGDPQGGTDERRNRDQPELLAQGDLDAGGGQARHDDAPQRPDAEAEELGVDRQNQIAAGDQGAAAAPVGRVLGIPAVDPPAAGVLRTDVLMLDVMVGGDGRCW